LGSLSGKTQFLWVSWLGALGSISLIHIAFWVWCAEVQITLSRNTSGTQAGWELRQVLVWTLPSICGNGMRFGLRKITWHHSQWIGLYWMHRAASHVVGTVLCRCKRC
jgi:hypothetical protein